MKALKKAGSWGCRSLSIETNQKIARVLRVFVNNNKSNLFSRFNKLRIIRIVADNSIVSKINNILTPSFMRKYWSK